MKTGDHVICCASDFQIDDINIKRNDIFLVEESYKSSSGDSVLPVDSLTLVGMEYYFSQSHFRKMTINEIRKAKIKKLNIF